MTDEIIQGSPEWHAIRCGKVTASRMSDLMARTKSGWGASRSNYMAELVAERLTGVPAERFTNAAMQWGTEKEPDARAAYAFAHNAEIQEIGFVPHPKIAMSGCSPDGLVGSDGLVEIKCPLTATHLDTLIAQRVPEKYVSQMQWQMACTGRDWCDFVSFDPRMPTSMQIFVKRVPRDGALIVQLEAAVREFISEMDAKIATLQRLYGELEAA